MNICIFDISEYTSAAVNGGMHRSLSLLAKELRRRGHHVDFYESKQSQRRPRIPIVSATFPALLASFFPFLYRSEGIRFRKFLEEHKIDVAIRWFSFHDFVGFKNLPCKLVTTFRTAPNSSQTYPDHLAQRLKLRSGLALRLVHSKLVSSTIQKLYDAWQRRILRHSLQYSDRFVMHSEAFKPALQKLLGVAEPPKNVCAIPNSAPFSAKSIDFSTKKKELLWVGRMVFAVKRPDFMLQIWQRLQDRFPDWSLRFIGDGEYLPELKALASSLGAKNVSFEGFQDPTPYYRSASIFCMTSAHEGFGVVLVEAQALGCVPVAFDSPGAFRDIIDDGENGFLVPPFDLDIYAEKLSQLMLNPELRERLAAAAQKNVSRFSLEKTGDRWEKLLREVVEADSTRQ